MTCEVSNIWSRQCRKLRQHDNSSFPYNSSPRRRHRPGSPGSPRNHAGTANRKQSSLNTRVQLHRELVHVAPQRLKNAQKAQCDVKKRSPQSSTNRGASRQPGVSPVRRKDPNPKNAQNGEEKCEELIKWLLRRLDHLKAKCQEVLNTNSEDEA